MKEIIFYVWITSVIINTIVVVIATNGHGFIPKSSKWETPLFICNIVYFMQVLTPVLSAVFFMIKDIINWF